MVLVVILAVALGSWALGWALDHVGERYDTKLWMRDLMAGAAYLPK